MEKNKNVLEILISIIQEQNQAINTEVNSKSDLNEILLLINKSFNEENNDFQNLILLKSDDFDKLMTILLKEDEIDLRKTIDASCFLMKNNIDLVREQIEKLEDLKYRANIKKRDVERSIEDKKNKINLLKEGKELVTELQSVLDNGYIDNETILKTIKMLGLKEEDSLKLVDDIIKFNLRRISGMNIMPDDTIDILEIETVSTKTNEENLNELLQKFGYDPTMLNKALLNLLISEGDIDNFEKILNSLDKNHINFMKNKTQKNAQLLTKFLLESSPEIIDGVSTIFKDSHINSDIIKNYRVVFFKSPEEKIKDAIIKRRNNSKGGGTITHPPKLEGLFNVTGKHNDFIKNLALLESYGYDRKELIENNVRLLTTAHSTVKQHISEVQLYEYSFGNDDFPLSTLSSYNVMDVTDRFIELGEENYIYKYSSRLTAYSNFMTDRIYALKQKGLPYKVEQGSQNMLLRCVYDSKMYCGILDDEIEEIIPKDVDIILKGNKYKELLDKYIPSKISTNTLEEPFVKELDEKFMISSKCYNFNGVLISRKKFLRNFEFLVETDLIPDNEKNLEQILLVSALHNSKLNTEQIAKVNNSLMGGISMGGNDGVSKK